MKLVFIFSIFLSLISFTSLANAQQQQPTSEDLQKFNYETQIQSKYTQRLTDIFNTCGNFAVTIYQQCTHFLEVLNKKTAEAFNETKNDIDKILYG